MKNKFKQFFQGRYGNDECNQFLFVIVWILFLITIFSKHILWNALFLGVIFIYFFRSLSKNYVARSIENDRFKHKKKHIVHRAKVIKMNIGDRAYKYYLCPKCTQMIRIPRGRGHLEIKCPACHHRFERKS